MNATHRPNPYLLQEHEPVAAEMSVEGLRVTGVIPAELNGMFARNTPNPQFPPQGRYHWFDGDGMVHGLRLEDGKASYVNRWIRTSGFEAEKAEGAPLWTGIMEPVKANGLKDTANTDLVVHNGKLLALWWMCGTPYQLDPRTLATVGPERFGGKLVRSVSAHAKVDPRTGELVFFDYSIVQKPWMRYGVVSASGELLRDEVIEIPVPHIQHDLALTERYTILIDLPLGWDRAMLAQGKRRIGFDRSLPARFGILPRLGGNGDIRWFEAESCYMYHTINAYEEGDEVVLVGCRVGDPIPKDQRTDGTVARLEFIELVPHLYRWRFNLKTGAVREEQLDDVATEFPRANDRTQGAPARYSYNPRIAPRSALSFDGLIKYDLHTGGSTRHEYEAGWYGGEAVFVPRPGATEEDDGWLVTCLTSAAEQRSRGVIFDARDLTLGPIASIELPQRIPLGFHTCWVPS
ncbi:MAG: carotenoid oxygenase family protein [Polyangiaceae bacterium]|jgi:carotenoid cleavage dioxygenase|nr:carotenoid oxygenase family protein [Polyangiaceae bacterium]